MQDLESSISIKMSFVKIYLNDIQEIIKILDGLSPSGVVLQAEGKIFTLDEVKDLKKEKVNNLKIKAHYAEDYYDITVGFDRFETCIYCHRLTNEIFGVCKKIESYLSKKERWFDFLAKNNRSAAISGVLMPIVLIMSSKIFLNRNQSIVFVSIYFLLSFLFIYSFYLSSGNKQLIILKDKIEDKSWFIKNKDQILVQILVGIFLLVIGILIGKQ